MLTLRRGLQLAARELAREKFWAGNDRESYECPMCGFGPSSTPRVFDVHHIDGDWLNNHIFNLVAICHRCHRRVHRLRNRMASLEEWRERFDELVRDEIDAVSPPQQQAIADGGGRIRQPDGRCPDCGERPYAKAGGGVWCPNCEQRGGY